MTSIKLPTAHSASRWLAHSPQFSKPGAAALSTASAADVSAFETLIGADHVLSPLKGSGTTDMARYNVDWMRQFQGCAAAVLQPATTAEVAAIVRYCYAHRIGLVPQGGNTGLVGGGVPIGSECVLSLERLRGVEPFDATTGALVAGAGCVLESLDQGLEQHGFMMPLDLGAKGECC